MTESIRRLALVAGLAAASVVAGAFANPAQASWCAVYQQGGENCGFSTQAQCAATVSGAGGFCRSSGYGYGTEPAPRRR
jgi:hypothetical protein